MPKVSDPTLASDLSRAILDVPDFPKPGIFRESASHQARPAAVATYH